LYCEQVRRLLAEQGKQRAKVTALVGIKTLLHDGADSRFLRRLNIGRRATCRLLSRREYYRTGKHAAGHVELSEVGGSHFELRAIHHLLAMRRWESHKAMCQHPALVVDPGPLDINGRTLANQGTVREHIEMQANHGALGNIDPDFYLIMQFSLFPFVCGLRGRARSGFDHIGGMALHILHSCQLEIEQAWQVLKRNRLSYRLCSKSLRARDGEVEQASAFLFR